MGCGHRGSGSWTDPIWHACGEGERVLALESREGTRASRRAAQCLGWAAKQPLGNAALGALFA